MHPAAPGVPAGFSAAKMPAASSAALGAEHELMGGKAGSLVGLEHVVGPAILRRQFEVRIQNASRIVYELELRRGRTGARAGNIARAIHLAAVKHAEERRMCVAEVVAISERDR